MEKQLKNGYKNTEVGVIPVDWEVKTLSDLSSLITKGTTPKKFTDTGITYVKIESLSGNTINTEKCLFISEVTHKTDLKRSILNEDDLLFAIAGATIGKCTIVPKKIIPANTNQALAIIRLKENESKMYIFYFLKSKLMQKYIIDNVAGGAQPNLNLAQVGGFFFPVPPTLAEQKAIATALSDADAYISSLEELIQKKQNIKQAAMQKLLKPKEHWEVKTLGEIGKVYGGLSGKSKIDFQKGKYPYIPFMNIMKNPKIDVSYLDYVNIKDNEVQNIAIKGDLFFNGSSETPEEVGMCSVLLDNIPRLYLNSFCFGFRLFDNTKHNGLYLSYFFRSSIGRELFYSMAQGATRYNLSKSNFLKLKLYFPPLFEQTQIANILSDMDSELEILEEQLQKAIQLKQGMMQNLLTGKIRLL